MNPINKLFNDLTDEELLVLLNEIEVCEKTGSYPMDSTIRELCRKIGQITEQEVSSNLFMAQVSVMRECSYRWKKILEN